MMRRLATPYALVGWVAAIVGAVGAIAFRMTDHVPVIPDTLGFGVTIRDTIAPRTLGIWLRASRR